MRQFVVLVLLLLICASAEQHGSLTEIKLTTTARFGKDWRETLSNGWRNLKRRVGNFRDRVFNKVRPMPANLSVQRKAVTNVNYVALGDSYAAGVGSGGGRLPVKRGDFDRCCYRNRNAYPTLLARAIGASHFDFRACSGAVMLKRRNSVEEQMKHAPTNAQLVTVTIGGNDMGFGDVVTSCLISSFAPKRCHAAIRRSVRRVRNVVGRDARTLQKRLRRRFPNAVIVFTGYPRPFARGGSKKTTGLCHSKSVQLAMNGLVDKLNAQLKRNVDNFVPVSFPGRELCNHPDSWIIGELKPAVRIAPRCNARRRFLRHVGGAYHVSSGGQLTYKRVLLGWYVNLMKRRRQ